MTPLILDLKNISKSFPGVRALDKVNFALEEGEVHGLVGENGAGKSTLIKIISGVYQRDAGEVIVQGEPQRDLNPSKVEALGIQFIYQEAMLVPEFTVAQSLFLGRESVVSRWFPLLRDRDMASRASEFIESKLNVKLDPNALIRDLSVAEQQIIQVARVLQTEPKVIAFDEPTAPLASAEIEQLFRIIRDLKERNISVIYISHYLSEIMEICDRVSVLRNGKNVDTLPTSATSEREVAALMVGQDHDNLYPPKSNGTGTEREIITEVRNLSRRNKFEDVSFSLRKGEILGITGIIGSGHHVLADVLYGLRPYHQGEIDIFNETVRNWSAVESVKKGVGLVPRDRRDEGLILDMSVKDNVNVGSYSKASVYGFLQHKKANDRAERMVKELGIRTPNIHQEVKYLSGGNQQKVVLARWLTVGSSIYILNDPTVGVDVGAKVEIYKLIRQLADDGAGIILISDDIPELLGMSDRILIMFRGKLIKELNNENLTADRVLQWTTGSYSE